MKSRYKPDTTVNLTKILLGIHSTILGQDNQEESNCLLALWQ